MCHEYVSQTLPAHASLLNCNTFAESYAVSLLCHSLKFNFPGWSFARTFDGLGKALLRGRPRWSKNTNLRGRSPVRSRAQFCECHAQQTQQHLAFEGVVWCTADDAYLADIRGVGGEALTCSRAEGTRILEATYQPEHFWLSTSLFVVTEMSSVCSYKPRL